MRYVTGRLALDGASLSVLPGEFAVILGANGSGKSTMLRIVAGIAKPSAGAVRIAGQDNTALTGRKLAVDVIVDLGLVAAGIEALCGIRATGKCFPLARRRRALRVRRWCRDHGLHRRSRNRDLYET